MPKWWLVARHEFVTHIRRRSFLLAAFGLPLLIVAIMIIVFSLVADNVSRDVTAPIGYVDHSGVLAQAVERPNNFTAFPDEDAARAALDAGNVAGYFVVQADYLQSGNISFYHSSDAPLRIDDAIDEYLAANLSAEVSDPALARLIRDPVNLEVRTLDNGRTIRDDGIMGVFIAPFIFVTIFLAVTQATSGYLMSSVVEEKANRIMEILITSVSPFQMLAGKLIGLGALGLVQIAVWLAAGGLVIALNRGTGILAGIDIPPDLVVLSLVYFLLFYFLYGAIMAGIGAVTGSEQESRQIAGIFGFIFAIPFFAIYTFFQDPNGPLPVALTLIPVTAPMVVILRSAFTAIPAWQIALSIVLMIATTILVVWISARIFRWSLLMYGKRPSLRMLMRALRPGARMQTTATGESAG
ncbi:MAG: ABC transporter permease [Anaerolineae bacterium]|nr:ABC transporter permease [Anaerolineae bacterium]